MTNSHADASSHVKMYMMVLAALLVGTVLTVLVARVDLGGSTNVIVALLIAGVKASLVASIFMHLKWESSGWIWWPLLLCAFFFLVLLLLPTIVMQDLPPRSLRGTWG